MKKIIILIAMLCSFGFCFIDYNKALPMLGNNCSLDESTNKMGNKLFICDSGYIKFDFDKKEVYMKYNTEPSNGHKRTVILTFNRGWTKTIQTHKNKSIIFWFIDEFNEPVYAEENRWSGNIQELYSDFKEKVFYKTESTNTTKNNDEYVPEGGWYTDSNDYLHYHFDSDGKAVCDTGYYWAEDGERCIKD